MILIFKGKRATLYKVFSFMLSLNIYFCIAVPIPHVKDVETDKQSLGASALISYLKKFGYLGNNGGSSSDHDMLYTQDSIEEAIKEMQKFGAVNQTGRLDNETLALLTRPRCGIPDVVKERNSNTRSKRYVIGSTGWNKRRISYRLENWAPQLDESTALSDLQKAFEVWADYARLHFINKPRWGQDDEADISVSFGRGHHGDVYPFDGSGGILAHAFFPYGHGSLGGDIHFDLDENWSSSLTGDVSENKISFLTVAVHEIGHSLGLSHSPSQDSVMFPYYQGFGEGNLDDVRLGYDDIMAMYKLYIQREIQDFGDASDPDISTSTTQRFTTQPPSSTSTSPSTATTHMHDLTTQSNKPFSTTATHQSAEDKNEDAKPDICDGGFDTLTFMRNELFVFKDKYMWRFKERRVAEPNYPVLTTRLFPMLRNAAKVDAAFENDEGHLLFFSGRHYWRFDGPRTEMHSPGLITDFGLPAEIDKLDAVFLWGKNQKIYFFSGNLFWRYNSFNKSIDEGYPKGIERWRGLPTNGIDSVMTWSDGITYFFKKDEFWRFDDLQVHTDEGFPMKTFSFWFGC